MAEIATLGDELEANFETGVLTNSTTGRSFRCSPTPAFIVNVLNAGGIYPYYNQHKKELS